ncbi:YoaK family protein [Mesorhizobium comanense]|uniref:YoaK family protein n=1 Tax=Mesorhizobium comanense TaxID=2502215 RepID=UPI0010F7EE23|nr:YoaK family protein [Mesorhizobium comanense]
MKPTLPLLLSLNGGYVDTAGFLALQGLFTAHVTGNFVTLGASLVLGISGVLAKLLALPVFCIVVILTRLAGERLRRHGWPALVVLLGTKLALLVVGAVLAIRLGPFANGDSLAAIVTGMVLVAAMAIQNAVHRVHLAAAPPSTLMTGTTTQIMIDIADLIGGTSPDARTALVTRLRRMAAAVAVFAAGCAAAALGYAFANVWCFVVPPVIALAALVLRLSTPEAETS